MASRLDFNHLTPSTYSLVEMDHNQKNEAFDITKYGDQILKKFDPKQSISIPMLEPSKSTKSTKSIGVQVEIKDTLNETDKKMLDSFCAFTIMCLMGMTFLGFELAAACGGAF